MNGSTRAAEHAFTENASWIWAQDLEDSPRNAWVCFRRDIVAGDGTAELRISADTQYVAYVNGVSVGSGPVRAFTEHWTFDSWDVSRLLRPGRPNALAVLVHHPGVSTFAARRARGGLIAELLVDNTSVTATDATWASGVHRGYDRRANRRGLQFGFTEYVDAGSWDADWTTADVVADPRWGPARVIGPDDRPPWQNLVPRPIPALRHSVRRASQVAGLAAVSATLDSRVIDLRSAFDPASADHANRLAYAGYLVFALEVGHGGSIALQFSGGPFGGATNPLAAGGRPYAPDEVEVLSPTVSRAVRTFDAGRHLVVLDVSRRDHGIPLRIALMPTGNATVSFARPAEDGAEFHVLGPFEDLLGANPLIPDQPLFPRVPAIAPEIAAAIGRATTWLDVQQLGIPITGVRAELVTPVDVMTNSAHPAERHLQATPTDLVAPRSGAPLAVPTLTGFDTQLVLDLGEIVTGSMRIDVTAPAGTILDLCGFEWSDAAGPAYTSDTDQTDNSLRYVTREGRQTYESPMRRGLRYCQVIVRRPPDRREAPVLLHEVSVVDSRFPTSDVADFSCSDEALTRIWRMAKRTVGACMHDVFVDSPVYEHTFWVGDLYSSSRSAEFAFGGSETLTAHCLRLAAQSAGQNPMITSHAPSGWDNVIPNWSFLWVLTCRDHWWRTGDLTLISEVWEPMRKTLDTFRDHVVGGLLDVEAWNFLDWAALDQPNAGIVTHQNLLMVMALDAAAELARALQRDEESNDLQRAAASLAAAIDTTLWDSTAQAYIDAAHTDGRRSHVISEHVQVLALLSGVATGERRTVLSRQLLDPPRDWVRIGSPWMSTFLYPALLDAGRADMVLDLVRDQFGAMLGDDTATCWETFTSPDHRPRSRCHAWSATPAQMLPRALFGIRPVEPGWRRVLIAPNPCGLTSAAGRIPLPDGGVLAVAWVREGSHLDVTIDSPSTTTVEIVLPAGHTGTISRTVVDSDSSPT